MGINCLQLLTRTYFITWCIIKLHTLLPQDTMGSENRKMGEQKMGGTSLISPTGQCRSLQTNKHQAVSGEVIFFPSRSCAQQLSWEILSWTLPGCVYGVCPDQPVSTGGTFISDQEPTVSQGTQPRGCPCLKNAPAPNTNLLLSQGNSIDSCNRNWRGCPSLC